MLNECEVDIFYKLKRALNRLLDDPDPRIAHGFELTINNIEIKVMVERNTERSRKDRGTQDDLSRKVHSTYIKHPHLEGGYCGKGSQ